MAPRILVTTPRRPRNGRLVSVILWGDSMLLTKMRSHLFVMLATATALLVGGTFASPSGSLGEHSHGIAPVATAVAPGVTRTYYIAADSVLWDYAPQNTNVIAGRPFNDDENVFVQNGPTRIGHVYRKAVYRGYTDATFKKLAPVKDPGLGLLGPVIRAEVGDTIKVVFKNNLDFPASIHPHGVFYTKAAEGAPYNDGTATADKADDAVQPGQTYTYTWQVPERAGPGPMDGSSVLWMYHSHTNEIADTNAGLVGPMVITRKGSAKPDGSPVDVDREVFSYFSVINENESPYLDQNLQELAQAPHEVAPDDEEGFEESNLMHSINGYVYGNGPTNSPAITLQKGQRVRWYVFTLGTEVDLHTPHWHGNTVLSMGMRTDMTHLLPGDMMTVDMQPDDVGTWLFHCHVNDHIAAGMQTLYKVTG
jgi:FtsP/CotA-like multicopper oxidase with cupredoxin domain